MLMRALFIFSFLLPIIVFSQNPVPNPGFEFWTQGEPDEWRTNNSLPTQITIQSTIDANAGNYAAEASVIDLTGTIIPPFLSAEGANGTGFPVSVDYTTLQCWYKVNLVGGDEFIVSVVMYDDSSNAIGSADVAITASASTFTQLSLPINYPVSTNVASCIIQFIAADSTGIVTAHLGTSFIIDDVELTGINSSGQEKRDIFLNVYPLPASDYIFVDTDFLQDGPAVITILDCMGKMVVQEEVQVSKMNYDKLRINFPGMSAGLYFLQLNQGIFRVTKKILVSGV